MKGTKSKSKLTQNSSNSKPKKVAVKKKPVTKVAKKQVPTTKLDISKKPAHERLKSDVMSVKQAAR